MGMFKKSCMLYSDKPEVKAPAPNPLNFKVKNTIQVNCHLVAWIHYPDCNNFEGDKVLLYLNLSEKELYAQKSLDPHFNKDRKVVSPFARFEPTFQGMEAGVILARYL